MICNNVYNSHPWCEGNTVNISSTSGSVFELQVCYEFCAHKPFFVFGFFTEKWQKLLFFFLRHLTNRDLRNIFVAKIQDLCYIYSNNPDEKLRMEWVCISDDGFGSFVQTGNFYILPPGCFCHFYMFVMNKLFYSECTRLRECVDFFYCFEEERVTMNTVAL